MESLYGTPINSYMYLVAFAPVNLLSSIILISKPCKSTGYTYIGKELFDVGTYFNLI